ncbi:MAG: hypothetical protein QW128_04095 [Thermoprotei archaeon]
MRPLPETVKNKIFELWMNGQDYRSISGQVNVSLGSITNVINEIRQALPDINELRILNSTLKRNSITINDAVEGAKFVLILKNLDVDVSSLGEVIGHIAKYGNEAPKILLKASELFRLEAEHGIEYDRIVEEYQRISKNFVKLQNDINTLRQEHSNLQNEIINLHELKELQKKLYELKIPIKRLDQIISQSQRLEELGFTPETAEILSSELIKHGINMETAIKTLIRMLSEYKSLTESIEIKRKELEDVQSELEKNKKLLEEIKWSKDFNEKVLNDLERLIKEKSNIISELDEEIKLKRIHIEEEIKKQQRELEEKHTRMIAELEKRLESLQASITSRQNEINKLERKRSELGDEIKMLQDTVELKIKDLEIRVKEIERKITLTEPLAKLVRLIDNPMEANNKSNLESLIPIMINIREAWEKHQERDPSKIASINEFIKSLDKLLEAIVGESTIGQ